MTLSIYQQVFCLSWLSNSAGDTVGTLSTLEAKVRTAVQDFVGRNPGNVDDWQIVWGPVAYSHHGTSGIHFADNMMYAAAAGNNLVIAIAGTNAPDFYDWTAEDFAVGTVVSWPYGTGGFSMGTPAHISQATATGIANLLAMSDPQHGSLLSFLQGYTRQHSGTTVIFTGHSLGGALSPTLAVAIIGQNGGVFANTTVATLPTAGATPGDAPFVTLYNHFLPPPTPVPQPLSAPTCFNIDIANRYDVVPTAWNNLNLVGFYHNTGDLAFQVEMRVMNTLLTNYFNALKKGNVYTNITHGTFSVASVPNSFSTLDGFFGLIAENHLVAYPTFFGVADPLADTTAMLTAAAKRRFQTGAVRITHMAQAQQPTTA